jgi:hypothetical protein
LAWLLGLSSQKTDERVNEEQRATAREVGVFIYLFGHLLKTLLPLIAPSLPLFVDPLYLKFVDQPLCVYACPTLK